MAMTSSEAAFYHPQYFDGSQPSTATLDARVALHPQAHYDVQAMGGSMLYPPPVSSSTLGQSPSSSSLSMDVDGCFPVSSQPLMYGGGGGMQGPFMHPFDQGLALLPPPPQHDHHSQAGLLGGPALLPSTLSFPSTSSFIPPFGSQPLPQSQPSCRSLSMSHAYSLPLHPPPHPSSSSSAHSHSHPSTASASDSCSQIAHVLMCYQQGGEDPEFVKKAIESLVKKLKDRREELDSLIAAVTSAGKTQTHCVSIQRSLDGRLQVAGRKGVPHVVYARIWRWPNVSKNELQKLSICEIQPDNQDYICVNPYHYERVVSSTAGSLEMASTPLRIDSGAFGGGTGSCAYGSPMAMGASAMDEMNNDEWSSVSRSTSVSMQEGGLHDNNNGFHHQQGVIYTPASGSMTRPHKFDLSRVQLPAMNLYLPEHWCTISYYELDTQIGEAFKVLIDSKEICVDGGMDPQGERHGRLCIGALPNVHRSSASEKARMHVGAGVVLRYQDCGRVTVEVRSLKPVFLRAPFMDFVKGTPYGSTVHRLTAEDGPVTISDLRWAYAEMSEQTQNANDAVVAQARAVAGLPVLHPIMPQASHDIVAGSGVDEMKRVFCSVGLSFVKGFGAGYNRQTIKECPVWIEMQLHRPLQLLDVLLKKNFV